MNVRTVVHPMRRVLATAVVGALAATGALSATPHEHAPARTESARVEPAAQQATPALAASTYRSRVVAAINRVRKRHHLRRLTTATCTRRVAARWSRRLAAHDAFHHQSMQALLKRCDARYAGETLARGSVTPNRIVRLWLDSPPHRHILLSRSPRRIGVGATPDAHGQWVVVGEFMRF